MQIYYLMALDLLFYRSKVQNGLAGLHSWRKLYGKIVSLPSPVSRGCQRSVACGPTPSNLCLHGQGSFLLVHILS